MFGCSSGKMGPGPISKINWMGIVFLFRGLIHQTHLFEYINNLKGFDFSYVGIFM
jgi:hypothetical protein